MKTYINLSFIAIMLLSFSCKTSEDVSTLSDNSDQTEEVIEPNTPPEETAEEVTPPSRPTFFASISRGACFGKCPIYEMFIYENGTAILKGERFVDNIGTFETTLTEEEIQKFTDTALEIGFMDLEDEYDTPKITDLPSATTMIRIDGVQKTVYRRSGYPQKLKIYEALFDDLLETKKWRNIGK